MVVVASIALSTMISNDIVAPLLWRQRLETGASLARRVLWVRRAIIVGLALVALRLLSFDFRTLPVLPPSVCWPSQPWRSLRPVCWQHCTGTAPPVMGVLCGMLSGFLLWGYLLFLPIVWRGGLITSASLRRRGACMALAAGPRRSLALGSHRPGCSAGPERQCIVMVAVSCIAV